MPIATDPLSLVFIACFLFGFLFLLASALLGSLGHGQHHAIHTGHHVHIGGISHGHGTAHFPGSQMHGHTTHGHSTGQGTKSVQASGSGQNFSLFSYVNPTSVVLFLLGFGFFGYVLKNTTALALPIALVLAAVCGCVIATLLLLLIDRVFGDSEGATVQDVSDRTGMLGKVSITIPENGLGEIIYISPGGMRKSIPARTVDGRRLARDQEVVVVSYQRGVAEVDTWDHFVNQEDAPAAISQANDDSLASLRALLEEAGHNDSEYVTRKDLPGE